MGINYPSSGCGRLAKHISFTDKSVSKNVGDIVEYSIRVIQTYTNRETGQVFENVVSAMNTIPYRIPFLSDIRGAVKTDAGTGVENANVYYCRYFSY